MRLVVIAEHSDQAISEIFHVRRGNALVGTRLIARLTDIDIGKINRITGSRSGLGHMQRKGLSSTFVRDEWDCYGPQGQHLASVKEESSALGILRRFVGLVALIAPQTYDVIVNGETLGTLVQTYNPLAAQYRCTVDDRLAQHLGWPLVYAIPNMLAIIENRQG